MVRLIVATLLFVWMSPLMGQDLPPKKQTVFQAGEELKYKVKYGILTVGEGNIKVEQTDFRFDNKPVWHLIGEGYTAGAFAIYKVRNRYDSYIDMENLTPYFYTENIREGSYRRGDKARFFQDKKLIVANQDSLKIETKTFDVISAYFFARSLDLTKIKPGDTFSINYFLTREVSKMDITYVGKEKIESALGYVNCLKFNPSIQLGRIFKKNSKLYLWIIDDGNRITVRAQVDIFLGSITIDLISAKGLKYPTIIEPKP